MAIRKVVGKDEELIRKKSKPVRDFDETLDQLLDDMWETMYAFDGMGLAAVQVGVLRRAFIIDVNGMKAEFINPQIYYTEGEWIEEEGCLSVGKLHGKVKRPYKIKVKAQDRYGNSFRLECEGWTAKCICHEADHLEGILFKDKLEKK